MSIIDWIILIITLLSIVLYGVWKSRGTKNIQGFLLADKKLPWYHVGLSVMATQASAITFLSAPGQAYSDGLRFVQFYFGLPLAMVVLCITFVPIFHKLNVYTAYEYLEKRFDNKTRSLTAFLFLLQRGLSTGITIYAPAIILSAILHIDITYTILFNGLLVISYTVYGGTKAVSYTQLFQMSIIFFGLFLAAYMVIHLLPENVGFMDALHIAGKMNKLNAIDTKFDLNNRYNIWSGIIGGFFLQLSYFGTDQSQVGRYLTGSSITQSRLGLVMNGLIKIPMQFLILLIGTLVFTFYQFHQAPVFFNQVEVNRIQEG
jgi:SSS family transporter